MGGNVPIDHAANAGFELRILAAALDRFREREFHRLVEAFPFGACKCLGVGSKFVVQPNGEVLRHGITLPAHLRTIMLPESFAAAC